MPSPRAEQPALLIVAGPNGSGKSSVYEDTAIELQKRTVWIVNPDLLTRSIMGCEGLGLADANLAAVQRIERWVEASIEVHKTIGVETVLSTGKYRRLVELAKQRGFAVWLLYVVLDTPERNIERVKLRVAKGGHDVAEADIRKRFTRSLEQMTWFIEQADLAWIWDNSGAKPRLVGEKTDGKIVLDPRAPRVVVDAFRRFPASSANVGRSG